MQTVVQYLNLVFEIVRPRHVVEIGADTPMELIAQTCNRSVAPYVERVSVLSFEKDNTARNLWWGSRLREGIPIARVDGDARELSGLISNADVVISHNVLYSANNGSDLGVWTDLKYGGARLKGPWVKRLKEGFLEAERVAMREAHKVAGEGRVIWFADESSEFYQEEYFRNFASVRGRQVVGNRAVALCGEKPNYTLMVLHSKPNSLIL